MYKLKKNFIMYDANDLLNKKVFILNCNTLETITMEDETRREFLCIVNNTKDADKSYEYFKKYEFFDKI